MPLALGHVRAAPPLEVLIPGLGQEQPPVQRARCGVGHRVHRHPHLAVGLLAQRPAVLRRHPNRPAAELGERGVIDHPRRRVQLGCHPSRQPLADRHRVPRALVDQLLQRLLQVPHLSLAGGLQPLGHGLDRLALAVQQQPTQVGLSPPTLVSARHGLEHALGERDQSLACLLQLGRAHGAPPACPLRRQYRSSHSAPTPATQTNLTEHY
jgi:hypothetical protein